MSSTFDPKAKIAASTLHRILTNDDDKISQADGMTEADDTEADDTEGAIANEKRTIQWKETEFVYEMSEELFSIVFDTETNTVKHVEYLYRKDSIAIEIDPIFSGCVISIDKYSACKTNWKLRAYCLHRGCRKYLLTATYENPRRFTIEIDKFNVCHVSQITRQLRRFERDKDAEALKCAPPRKVRANNIKAVNDDIAIAGNYQGVQSIEVLQKVRSDALKNQDKCSDDIDDVEAMRTNDPNTNFISNTLSRKHFAVYIHSKRQHDILLKLHLLREKFGIQIVGRTDASGNIARDIEAGVLLYYALTCNIGIKNDKITSPLPFSEQFNVSHTSIDIARWLFDFVLSHAYFFENHPLLFDWMVTDFSYANFHAILKAFNSISLKEYLNLAMQWVQDKQINGNFADMFFKMVKVRMCHTHLMHTFALMTKRLYGKNKSKQLPHSKIILEILGTMIKANDYQLLLKCWKQLVTLLKSEYVNDHVNDAVLQIDNIKESAIDLNEYDEEKLVKAVDVENLPEYDATLYKSNLFYQQFSEISDKVVPYEYEKAKEKNIYYNPEFLQKFLVRFVPLIPLWTSILSYESKSTTDDPPPLSVLQHLHNQPIENYFGYYKMELEQNMNKLGCLPIKMGRAISFSQEMINTTIKSINCTIPKSRLNTQRPRKPYTKRKLKETAVEQESDDESHESGDDLTVSPVESNSVESMGKLMESNSVEPMGKLMESNSVEPMGKLMESNSVQPKGELIQSDSLQPKGESASTRRSARVRKNSVQPAKRSTIFPKKYNDYLTMCPVEKNSVQPKGKLIQSDSLQPKGESASTRRSARVRKKCSDENVTSFAESKESFNKKRPVKNFTYFVGKHTHKAANRILTTSNKINANKPPIFPNGLWQNVNLYRNLDAEFILCKKNGSSLTNKTFDALNPTQLIPEQLMHYLLNSLPHTVNGIASNNGIVQWQLQSRTKFQVEFITTCTENGWALLVVDYAKKSFSFINKHLLTSDNFTPALQSKKYTEFENLPPNNYNSGLFVYKCILEYISTGAVTDKEFSAESFCNNLQKKVVEESENVMDDCTICGLSDDGTTMGECTLCNRWVHCRCMQVTADQIAKDDHFKCHICIISNLNEMDETVFIDLLN